MNDRAAHGLQPRPSALDSAVPCELQVPLGIDRGHATGPRSGNRLSVGRILHIPCGEHPRYARGRPVLGHDISFGVHVYLPGKQSRVRVMTDGDEDAGDGECRGGAHDQILEPDAADDVVAENIFDNGIPNEGNPLVLERPVLHDFGRAQLISPVDHKHPCGKLRQKIGLFHRAVSAPHDDQFLAAKEKAIACRAGRDAVTGQSCLVVEADLDRRSAGGDDDGPGMDLLFVVNGDRERMFAEFYRSDVACQKGRAEALRLRPHLLHEIRAHDALGKAWKILHFRGGGELSAGLPTFNEEGSQIGTSGIHRCSETRRSRTDDEHVVHGVNLAQGSSRLQVGG